LARQFAVEPAPPFRHIGGRMDDKELTEFVARLPAHLRFFFDPLPEDLEHEEFLEFMRARTTRVREFRDELMAHGVAADRFLADAEPKLADVEKVCAEVDQAEDKLLNARADLADAQYKLFCELKKALAHMEENAPFDPKTEELREELEEWAKIFPKE
jgi:hypothetical protein